MKKFFIYFLVCCFLFFVVSFVFAGESSNSPGTMADDDAVGSHAWTDVNEATTSNDDYAEADEIGFEAYTHYLKATNFGFSIPSGTPIEGIKVEIERHRESGIREIMDEYVKIVKSDGSIGTENKADTITDWPTSDGTTSYGGTEDLWSEEWDDTDINNANFGVVLSAVAGVGFPLGHALVDHIRITVYYTSDEEEEMETIELIQNTTTGAEFYLDKTISYGDFLVSIFLLILIIATIIKIIFDTEIPKRINFKRQ